MTNYLGHNLKLIRLATAFSGIGAVEQAFHQCGIQHQIVFAGDIDPFCKQSYFANYPILEDQWHNDVHDFSAKQYDGAVDLYVGGSPCQSFSIMGKRKGFEEARGTLFYEYARIVKECNPKAFIFENVTGILNHDKGHTWEVISSVFNELHYSWTYWVLNAKEFGLPQNRARIFVVGFREDCAPFFNNLSKPNKIELTKCVQDLLDKDIPNKYYLPEKGFVRVIDPNQTKHVALNSKISRCQVACQQYNWFGDMRFETDYPQRVEDDPRIHKGTFKGVHGVTRCLTPRECLRLMGFSDDFNLVVNDQQLYRQSGNSIAVPVIKAVVNQIIETGIYDE